jgi:hypothetical protein
MADTLAEIYRGTLTESDFDSNGEATIVTTDSSTSHVIKSVQAEEVNSQLPVAGTMEVNGFDIVGLTANSSGTEIIAPSSTVKVKTDAIPFVYLDDRFFVQSTSTNLVSTTNAKLNGTVALSNILDTTNALPTGMSANDTWRVVAPFLGPNNNTFFSFDNTNNTTNAYLYDTSGNTVWTETTGYVPKWFDGYRYVYHMTPGSGGIDRVDTWASSNASTQIVSFSFPSTTTYSRTFGIRDKWLFFWPDHSGSKGYALNLQTNTVQDLTINNADNAFASMSLQFHAVEVSTGYYIFENDGNQIQYWSWDGTQILDGTTQGQRVDVSLSGSAEQFRNAGSSNKVAVGTKFYYINNNNNLAYFEFEGTPAWGGEVTSNAFAATAPYGSDVTYVEVTPTASEISARTYNANIGLKLRITGVTST